MLHKELLRAHTKAALMVVNATVFAGGTQLGQTEV
jgi:hypothetical protein